MSNRNYWLDLFTGVTWKEFLAAGADVSGFRESRWSCGAKDSNPALFALLPYGVSRFIGVLEVISAPSQTQSDLEG